MKIKTFKEKMKEMKEGRVKRKKQVLKKEKKSFVKISISSKKEIILS